MATPVISTEQLKRMEENKRKARERLAVKKRQPHTGISSSGPPPAKRPALETSSHQTTSSSSCSSHSLYRTQPQASATFAAAPNTRPTASSCQNIKSSATKMHHTSHETRPFYSKPPASTSHTLSTTSASEASSQIKFSALQEKIKANLTLVSKSRFKVIVPYESNVIEIFKKMPTRSYDAKHSTWSFGIEDYQTLVGTLQRECKYVQMSLIPKPVLSQFLHSKTTAKPSMDWSRVNSTLASTLMEFQKEGVEFSIRRGGRALIADDMGLGKTLQALAVMCYYSTDWPLLVICPSSVRITWSEALLRWIPTLREEDINVVFTAKISATKGLVNIISYDLVVRMAKEVQEKRFRAVIVDESHFLKNYKTARCKAVLPIVKEFDLTQNATRCLLLSGTPALSRPIELFTQLTALEKSFKVSLVEFGVRYCNGAKNQFGWDFSGASNMHELQMYMEEAVMIRRMKNDVLDQLPSKTRQMVLLDPSLTKGKSKEWKEMKRELEKAGKLKNLEKKSALLPLFSKTGIMKIPAIRDYILDLLEGGRKIIVFGHHRAVLDAICETLDHKKYEYIRIDGRTPAELRQTYCDQFQHNEKCLVAVLSITTANAGLTLTAASTVVFAELFWNPGILVQAEDRAYRIGQKDAVIVHYLVARDTADDFIWPLVQNKLSVLSSAGLAKDDFSEASSTVLKDMSQKDLLECFDELVLEEMEAQGSKTSATNTTCLPSSKKVSSEKKISPAKKISSTKNADIRSYGERKPQQQETSKSIGGLGTNESSYESDEVVHLKPCGEQFKGRQDDFKAGKQSSATKIASYLIQQASSNPSNLPCHSGSSSSTYTSGHTTSSIATRSSTSDGCTTSGQLASASDGYSTSGQPSDGGSTSSSVVHVHSSVESDVPHVVFETRGEFQFNDEDLFDELEYGDDDTADDTYKYYS